MKDNEKTKEEKFEDKIESLLDSWATQLKDKPVTATIKVIILIWIVKVAYKHIKS